MNDIWFKNILYEAEMERKKEIRKVKEIIFTAGIIIGYYLK